MRSSIPPWIAVALLLGACRAESTPPRRDPSTLAPRPAELAPGRAQPADDRQAERDLLVDAIAGAGVADPRVLQAMRRVRRHEMVPEHLRDRAYHDYPLPIGHGQTISQPYVVAAMTEAAQLTAGEKVLEVGTGSGYQAAVLAELGDVEVYSIEIVEPLAIRTHELLRRMGYEDLHLRIGDGYRGWPEAAPFDAIIVTAAPPEIPPPLVAQLATAGRLVIPVGDHEQHLQVITKLPDGSATVENLFAVRFVPMTGEAQVGR